MNLLIDGVKVGLILCFLIGPIFFALIQTGVEEGFRAGAMVGAGIWVSDFLFMVATYSGVTYIDRIIHWDNFPIVLGLGGSIILILFGLGAVLKPPAFHYLERTRAQRTSSYFSLWLKGFLINTVNPFTILFWTGLMSTMVVGNSIKGSDALFFFGAILATIIITDSIKVLLAKRIRNILQPRQLLWFRRLSGAALIVFGIVLLVRVAVF